MNDVIKHEIVLNEYRSELLVAVPPELNFRPISSDPPDFVEFVILVYRLDRQVSRNEFAYVFSGSRTRSLPNKHVQRTFATCAEELHTRLYDEGDIYCRYCGTPLSR
jgi:hypothetical protein